MNDRSEKAPYHTPTLQLHGSISEITAAGPLPAGPDSATGSWGAAPGAS